MDRGAEVDEGGAGGHLGVDDVVLVEALAPLGDRQRRARPQVAAGDEAGGAVLPGEVDERQHRRQLQLAARG